MLNRYFVIDIPNPNMSRIYDIVVGSEDTQRLSLDGTKMVVKLPVGDDTNHPILNSASEYNYDEIMIFLDSPEWEEDVI